MSYTTAQEAAFEALLRKVRGRDPFDIVKTVQALAVDGDFRRLGIPPTVRALADLMRSPPWVAFVKDYEEIRRSRAVAEAIGLVPNHLAQIMAAEMRTEMHKRRRIPAGPVLEAANALFGDGPSTPPATHVIPAPPPTMADLTGSTFRDTSVPDFLDSAPPPPREHPSADGGPATNRAVPGGATAGDSPISDAIAAFSTGDVDE